MAGAATHLGVERTISTCRCSAVAGLKSAGSPAHDHDRIVLTGLTGASSGNQRHVRAGIDHYDTTSTNEMVTAVHASIAIGKSGWFGAP